MAHPTSSNIVRTFSYILLSFGLAFTAKANVSLPVIFSDHMVFQRERPVPVWGWAEADEEVKVAFAGQSKTTKADANGRWKVSLDVLRASDHAQDLTVAKRLEAVRAGRRNAGQQVIEVVVSNVPGPAEAEAAVARFLEKSIQL